MAGKIFLAGCLFILLISELMINHGLANRDGAPCAAQNNLQPSPIFHGTPQNIEANPPPFTIRVEDTDGSAVRSYKAGQVYTCEYYYSYSQFLLKSFQYNLFAILVKIDAKVGLRGFLIQPRAATKERELIGHLKVGEFLYDPSWSDQGIQFQNCQSNSNDSVTHADNSKRKSLSLKWRSLSGSGPVQFALSLVSEQSIFWELWRPESAFLLGPGDTSPPTDSVSVLTTPDSENPLSSTNDDDDDNGSIDDVSPTTSLTTTTTRTTTIPPTKKPKRRIKVKKISSSTTGNNEDQSSTLSSDVKSSLSKIRQTEFLKRFSGERFKHVEKTSEKSSSEQKASPETLDSVVDCPSYLCENGGTCAVDDGHYFCICPRGFSGQHCDERSKTKKNPDKPGRRQKHSESETTAPAPTSDDGVNDESVASSAFESSAEKSSSLLPSDATEQSVTASTQASTENVAQSTKATTIENAGEPVLSSRYTSVPIINLDRDTDKPKIFANRKININFLTTTTAPSKQNSSSSEDTSKEQQKNDENEIVKILNKSGETKPKEKKRKKSRGGSSPSKNSAEQPDLSDDLPLPPLNPTIDKMAAKLFLDNGFIVKNGLKSLKNPNPCDDHQCRNSGECIPNGKNYTCKCYGEFDGPFCQCKFQLILAGDCPAYLCKNGGTCFIDNTFNYLCRCKPGFTGGHCEIKPKVVGKAELVRTVKRIFDADPNVGDLIEESFNKTQIDDKFDTEFVKEIASNQIDDTKRAKFIQA
uniref:EGF-like domain-containing protein n=1 Tax=Romanomermis culicivorax TaxID=13658 RepID=A0A915K7G0_ROMCU